jgi:hypothetical protein
MKGARGEREVLAIVAEWWRRVEPDFVFVRSPGSGGWSHAPAFKAKGDGTARRSNGEPSTFPFLLEVKRREGFSWERVAAGKLGPVKGWWEKTCVQARAQDAIPLLVFRKSREPWRVMAPGLLVADLEALALVDPQEVVSFTRSKWSTDGNQESK